MKVETVLGSLSDDVEEVARLYRQQLAELQEAYRREAKPILDRLTEIEAMRRRHYFITGDDLATPQQRTP